jgi:hypothetical protein
MAGSSSFVKRRACATNTGAGWAPQSKAQRLPWLETVCISKRWPSSGGLLARPRSMQKLLRLQFAQHKKNQVNQIVDHIDR